MTTHEEAKAIVTRVVSALRALEREDRSLRDRLSRAALILNGSLGISATMTDALALDTLARSAERAAEILLAARPSIADQHVATRVDSVTADLIALAHEGALAEAQRLRRSGIKIP